MVRRILFAMFDSGVYDDPVPMLPCEHAGAPGVGDADLRVRMVLLKNHDHALPLSGRHLRSLAAIGPSGDDAMYINGGSAAVPITAGPAITPLAGIAARAGAGVHSERRAGIARRRAAAHHGPERRPYPGVGHAGTGCSAVTGATASNSGARDTHPGRPDRRRRGAPGDLGPVWSARWTGTLTPPETGLYRLSLLEAGIAKLYVDRPSGHVGLPRGHAVPRRSPSTPRAGRCSSPRVGRRGSASSTRASPGCSAPRSSSNGSRRRPPASPPPSRRPSAQTSRSCSPTRSTARRSTARISRCPATRTS